MRDQNELYLNQLWEEEETSVKKEMEQTNFIIANGESRQFYRQMLKIKQQYDNNIPKLVKAYSDKIMDLFNKKYKKNSTPQ